MCISHDFTRFPARVHDFEGMKKARNAIWSRSVQEFGRELCSGPVWWRKRCSLNIDKYLREGRRGNQTRTLNSCSLRAARAQRSDFDDLYLYIYVHCVHIYMFTLYIHIYIFLFFLGFFFVFLLCCNPFMYLVNRICDDRSLSVTRICADDFGSAPKSLLSLRHQAATFPLLPSVLA